jgi:hypothetical protein
VEVSEAWFSIMLITAQSKTQDAERFLTCRGVHQPLRSEYDSLTSRILFHGNLLSRLKIIAETAGNSTQSDRVAGLPGATSGNALPHLGLFGRKGSRQVELENSVFQCCRDLRRVNISRQVEHAQDLG